MCSVLVVACVLAGCPPSLAASPGAIVFTSTRDGNQEVYVMNPDGSGQTRLTENLAKDFWARWSPDGTQIAFTSSRDGNWNVYVMDADGSGQTPLTTDPADDGYPTWSPDGAHIGFMSLRDGNEEIYVMNADGTAQTRLTDNAARDYLPSWSPDGDRIAFTSSRDGGNLEVYRMKSDGTAQTRLTNSSGGDANPSWSPDGTRITFHSYRDGNWEVYAMGADGSGQANLTANPATDYEPCWIPDGERIGFSSGRDGDSEIYAMGVDGSGQTNLTNCPSGEDGYADWCSAPGLEWGGDPGYESDGVDPDSGDPNSTTFTFRVKYTDPTGTAPTLARCAVQRKDCGKAWQGCATLALTKESGDIETGAIYSGSTQLPNVTLKYRFRFKDGDGEAVPGDPNTWLQGPLMTGVPHLCWSENAGFGTDGVDPDCGPISTTFQFEVLYADSAGDAPTTHQLLVRKDGKPWHTEEMTAATGGNYRFGKVYEASLAIDQAGTYRYCFSFADASGKALGPAAKWTSGPTITGGTAIVTAIAALPTGAGAQVTFSLTDAAEVTATVLNVAGRPVRTVLPGRQMEAGTQTLVWDAKSEAGLRVPAGVYLVRVTARSREGGQSSGIAVVRVR